MVNSRQRSLRLNGNSDTGKELKVHIDATLKLLDPDVDLDKIKKRRTPDKRVKLFRAGELGRMILDAIRRAGGPISTGEVVTAIIAAGGHGDGVRPTVGPRVRSNLGYLERRGKGREGGKRHGREVAAKIIRIIV